MDYELHNFRHALEILSPNPAWHQLDDVIRGIGREDIIQRQLDISGVGRVPKGGQTAVNALFDDRLIGWRRQPLLFGPSPELREWKMDFLVDRVGVEISFNHAEAIAWQLTRLTVAGESPAVLEGSRIDVGIVVTATRALKAWSRMDAAVGTFDVFRAWLDQMRPILPIPLLLVGLKADGWAPTGAFPGTTRRSVAAARPSNSLLP
jgi:hypothetical protein